MHLHLDRALQIAGWMSHLELRWLAEQATRARTIIEIGSWKGRSTRALGDNVQAGGTVYAIDHWIGQLFDPSAGPNAELHRRGSEACYQDFRANVADLIESGRIYPIRLNSEQAFPAVKAALYNTTRQADLVFIDGDHQYAGCKADILAYRTLLRQGGILSGHDYNGLERHRGVKESVDELYPQARHVGTIWWVTV